MRKLSTVTLVVMCQKPARKQVLAWPGTPSLTVGLLTPSSRNHRADNSSVLPAILIEDGYCGNQICNRA